MSSFLFCFSEKKDFLCFTLLIYRYNRSVKELVAHIVVFSVKLDINVLIGVKRQKRLRGSGKALPANVRVDVKSLKKRVVILRFLPIYHIGLYLRGRVSARKNDSRFLVAPTL